MQIKGNLVDILQQNIYPAEITIENGKILSITPLANTPASAPIVTGV